MFVATRRREQEVWQACDDLWAMHGDMKLVTGDGIRERLISLGKSRGSPNEIYKYRKTWALSRGLANVPISDTSEDTDPISRAVRLVHEQLRDSTESKIDSIKQEFERELLAKDEALIASKKSLDGVLAEYAALEQKLSATTKELRVLEPQLAAEIDLRKASEKEVALLKSQLLGEQTHGQRLLSELKAVFSSEVARFAEREHELAARHEAQIKELNERMQNLGHDYSERLMELQTKIVNLDIIGQQKAAKLAQAHDRLVQMEQELLQSRDALAQALRESVRLSTMLALKDEALRTELLRLHATNDDHARTKYALKQAERTITHLRACMHHRGRDDHGAT